MQLLNYLNKIVDDIDLKLLKINVYIAEIRSAQHVNSLFRRVEANRLAAEFEELGYAFLNMAREMNEHHEQWVQEGRPIRPNTRKFVRHYRRSDLIADESILDPNAAPQDWSPFED